MEWYEELDFDENPLEVNPFEIDVDAIGYEEELEDLLYFVESGNIVIIEGPSGSGKTLLLSKVVDEYKGKGRIIYIDGNKFNKRLDISDVLISNQSYVNKVLSKKPKGMILLVDNVESLNKVAYEQIQYYFDQDYLKSVVFATKNIKDVGFPQSILDRAGNRIIKLNAPDESLAADIVWDRLHKDLLSKDQLEKLFVISDKNMEAFFKNTEKVLMYMVDNELQTIDLKTITKIIGRKPDEEEVIEEDPYICSECGTKLEKVGDYYRCPNCDLYCPVCGILIEGTEEYCPNCGVKFEYEDDNEEE